MATKRLYQVYDLVSQELVGPVQVFPSHAPAIRTFQDSLGHKDSFLAMHPGDYSLIHLGDLDLSTGQLAPSSPTIDPVANLACIVARGSDFAPSAQLPLTAQENGSRG